MYRPSPEELARGQHSSAQATPPQSASILPRAKEQGLFRYAFLFLYAYCMSRNSYLICAPLGQQRTNPGKQVALATRFCAWRLILQVSVIGTLHVNFLAPRTLKWFLDFRKMCASYL